MAITHNLVVEQGATFTKKVVYEVDGVPVDLVAGAYSARMKARKGFDKGEVIFSLASGPNEGIVLGTDGSIVITISDAYSDSKKFDQRVLVTNYDLELEDNVGVIYRLLEGKLTLKKNQSRNDSSTGIDEGAVDQSLRGFATQVSDGVFATRDMVASIEPDKLGIDVQNSSGHAVNPTFGLDVNGLDTLDNVANGDQVIVYDANTGTNKKASVAELHSLIQADLNAVASRADDLEAADIVHNNERAADLAAQAIVDQNQDTATALVQTNLDDYETSNDAALASEVATRAADDATLQTNIDAVQADVDANEAAQLIKDTAQDTATALVQTNLDAEAVIRQSEDDALQALIDAEVADRTAAVSAVQADVDANETTAANATALVQTNLDAYETSNDAALASEVATRLANDNTLQVNIDAVQADVDANEVITTAADAQNVKITGDQTIAGTKTYSGDVTVEGLATLNNVIIKSQNELDVGDAIVLLNAEETGTPSVDGGIEVERGTSTNARLVFDESEDKWAAGLVGSLVPLSFEGHTHTEGDITDLDKYTQAEVDAIAATKSNTGHTHTESDITDLDKYTQAQVDAIAATKSNTGHTHLKVDITDFDDADYATAAQGVKADNALPLFGGTLTGDFTVDNGNYPAITVNGGVGKYGNLFFEEDGVVNAHVNGRPGELRLTRVHSTAGEDTWMKLGDTTIAVNKTITGIDPTAPAHLTTKTYVDDNFVKNTGDVTITDVNDLYFNLDSGNNPILLFKTNGDVSGRVYSNTSSFNITHYDENDATNNVKIYPDYTLFEKPIIGVAPTGDAHLTRKDYVDGNFLKLTGGTLTNNLFTQNLFVDGTTGLHTDKIRARSSASIYSVSPFTYASSVISGFDYPNEGGGTIVPKSYIDDNFVGLSGNEYIDGYKSFTQDVAIDKPSGNPLQIFRVNGKNEGLVGLVSGAMRLRTYKEENGSQVTANELVIFEGNSSFTQDVRCNNMGSAATSLTTKQYVDDAIAAAIAAL